VSLLVTQGYASDLASPSFSCLPSGYILFVPAPGAGKKVLLLSSSPLVLVCCVARSLTPYIPSSCLKTFQKLTRPPLIERKVTSLRSQSHAILYKQTRHLNIRPKTKSTMQYSTALILAVASLAAAQSTSTTTSSAATSSATGTNQSGCGQAIDAYENNSTTASSPQEPY
jgi:hypothetical protein